MVIGVETEGMMLGSFRRRRGYGGTGTLLPLESEREDFGFNPGRRLGDSPLLG
jgi:hypothetical protein